MKKLVTILETTPRGDLYLCRGERTRYLRQPVADGNVIWSAARQFAGAWEADETVELPVGTEMCIVDTHDTPLYVETIADSTGAVMQLAPFTQDAVKAVYDECAERYNLVDDEALYDWLALDAAEYGEHDLHTWIANKKYVDVEYSEPETRELLGHKITVARWDYTHRVCGKKYSAIEVQSDIGRFAWPSGNIIGG